MPEEKVVPNTVPQTDPDVDPWLDAEFSQPDFRPTKEDFANQPEVTPEIITNIPAPTPEAVEPTQPKIIKLEDGSTIKEEETPQGYKITLDQGSGAGKEVFHGHTKEEAYQNLAVGKLNASKKIRLQEKEIKSRVQKTDKPEPTNKGKVLTADEKFALKTKFDSDPASAIEEYFETVYGIKTADIIEGAKQGRHAKQEQETGAIAREFVSRNPDYYADIDNKNYYSLVSYIFKKNSNDRQYDKLSGNFDLMFGFIVENNFWTLKNLEDAFEGLAQAGLLVAAPEPSSEPEEVPVPPVPTPTPPTPSGIPNVRRTRAAALGLRRDDATAQPPTTSTDAPSVEDLDNLSNAELNKLMADTIALRAKTNRR